MKKKTKSLYWKCGFTRWTTWLTSSSRYNRLRVIRIQLDLKNNSDYAKIRNTRSKIHYGFVHFDQKICSDYAEEITLLSVIFDPKFCSDYAIIRITRRKIHRFWSFWPENLFGLRDNSVLRTPIRITHWVYTVALLPMAILGFVHCVPVSPGLRVVSRFPSLRMAAVADGDWDMN